MSTIAISAERLRANFAAVQRAAGAEAQVLAVIKADGYGHGAALCAPVLRDAGARWFGVTDVAEGRAVRVALGEDADATRILVMCGMLAEDAPALIAHELTPVIWTRAHIDALETAAQASGRRVRVHLEVDTGMARQGAASADLPGLLDRLSNSSWLVCEGILGHLCCAETSGAPATQAAERAFREAASVSLAQTVPPEFLHLENTSALDEGAVGRWMEHAYSRSGAQRMVRTGLALFGYTLPLDGAEEHAPQLHNELAPVMTWTAPVIGLRDIVAGTTVGYGATFTAPHAMRLALLPVGYADGFRREASSGIGNGWVRIAGRRAPVAGRVSMNLTTVDITGIESVRVGDEVVLLGEGVSAEDHARWAGTIAYDILCGVRGHRVLAEQGRRV